TAALADLPAVTGVRGLGLLLAAQLAPGLDARVVAAEALVRGLIVNAVTPSALRLAPSLLVTDDEIDEAVATLAAILADQEVAP
ncbi:MAG: acetylornithine/succinylornithine aminotransferase, partial [Acidimicrobiales bacterium]|nr:acetylornithine/succinylornithine aminotransferase [Acidimicrobiales bacterium]